MRPILTFILLASALVVLAGVGVGVMIGVASGKPSPILIGVFVVDSLAVLVVAWRVTAGHGRDS